MTDSIQYAASPPVEVRKMSSEALRQLNENAKLALQQPDLEKIQRHFEKEGRDPTRLELESLAQSWSEHCKHRIFHAEIHHTRNGHTEVVDGVFETYVQQVTETIRDKKPDFVLSAFKDNAGFIRLGTDHGVCMKVETHNHPSAIEPYAGANTGIGGVIRDILGAGKGARPVASVDVFCLGDPDCDPTDLPDSVIHPQGMLRGVVRGVRDYGNRMGIPTVAGAIHFDPSYRFNPLVFCGTVGVIPREAIPKSVRPGLRLVTAGGRTGRDGLHGATFSSDSLSLESHEEDQQSVQIGNPIEEKKVADFLMAAREEDLYECITDCGAGGFSSAVGEMVAPVGGDIHLDRAPLKEEGLEPWEIFLSESQERMVLAVPEADLDRLHTLAAIHETECTVIGRVRDTGRLRIYHEGNRVGDLDCDFLHSPPRRTLSSRYEPRLQTAPSSDLDCPPAPRVLKDLLEDVNLSSREPVIREYDFEVQGNTLMKPLAGPGGDNPQDGVGLELGSGGQTVAVGLALLPKYGELNPYHMGLATVDEAVRQIVCSGADPDRIGVLDNFSMGNPEDPEELGRLVECARGMAEAARAFQTPFISGKDSFYNYFETDDGRTVSIPTTLVVSALGVVEDPSDLLSSSVQEPGSVLCLLGESKCELGGSALYNRYDVNGGDVPGGSAASHRTRYQAFHRCVRQGWILSAHDVSEGGLGCALAEAAFSGRAGLEIQTHRVPTAASMDPVELLFCESAGRILFEIEPDRLEDVSDQFHGMPFATIGETTEEHRDLVMKNRDHILIHEPIEELKQGWKNSLEQYY